MALSGEKSRLLPVQRVEARYGGISKMTIWRWLSRPDTGFPAPVKINGRNYWHELELDEFDRRQPRRRHRGGGTE